MDLTKLTITAEFLRTHATLSWNEVIFGLDNDLLCEDSVPQLAAQRVASEAAPSAPLVDLAGLGKGEPTRSLVEALVKLEQVPDPESVRRKWLYLTLAWVFEHRASDPDPLGTVEAIYADFGYPTSIASFVRYMPSHGPLFASKEANEARLFARWAAFLDEASKEYAEVREDVAT